MDSFFKKVSDLSVRPAVVTVAWVIANFSAVLGILAYFKLEPAESWRGLVLLGVCCAFSGFVFWCIYNTYLENKRLKLCAHEIHQINHHYRDALAARFFDPVMPPASDDEIVITETVILGKICYRIASILQYLTNRKCFVGVYLIQPSNNGPICALHAFSEDDFLRCARPIQKFSVSPANTRFWEAGRKRGNGICHFYADDLTKLGADYNDEMQHWDSKYRSCLAVPIRYFPNRNDAQPDDIGFLVADTKHANRFKGDFQVELLAAFADQMYNFQSIWRGRNERKPQPKDTANHEHN